MRIRLNMRIVGLKGENSAVFTDGIHDVRGFPQSGEGSP